MRRATLAGFILCAVTCFAQSPLGPPVLLTPSRALLLFEPNLVVGQHVSSFSASPSGRYLVAFREVPSASPLRLEDEQPPEPLAKQIVVWDSQTGATKTILLPKECVPARCSLDWFAGTDKALVTVWFSRITVPNPDHHEGGEPTKVLSDAVERHTINAATCAMKPVQPAEPVYDLRHSYVMCPVAPVAVRVEQTAVSVRGTNAITGKMEWQNWRSVTLQTLDADGRWHNPVKLPSNVGPAANSGWTTDGRTFQLEVEQRPADGGRPASKILRFEPGSGSFEIVAGPVESYEPAPLQQEVILSYEAKPFEGTRLGVISWWLRSQSETEKSSALVAEHSRSAKLANGERFVAFVVNDALFTRQIVDMTLEQYQKMVVEAAKARAMSNAKQVALSALMYANDYDDRLPPGLTTDDLEPYAKNSSIFDGFVLVFPGGDITKLEHRARIALGYLDTPYGRAVAYLDGHVEWEGRGG